MQRAFKRNSNFWQTEDYPASTHSQNRFYDYENFCLVVYRSSCTLIDGNSKNTNLYEKTFQKQVRSLKMNTDNS